MKRSALVTGATGGIGTAVTKALAHDHHIFIGGRSDKAGFIAQNYPSAQPFIADLRDEAALTAAAKQVKHLDLLVHNAGICPIGKVAELSSAQWQEAFEVNLFAVAHLTKILLPKLRASHGHVVLINSGAGRASGPNYSLYAGTKFALRAFADALREEERGEIRVSTILPGRVDTQMQVELQAAAGRPYVPEQHLAPLSVARAVRLAIDADPSASYEEIVVRPTFGALS